MKKDEAKRLVLREWDDWAAKNVPPGQKARGTDGLIFFGYLQKQRPHLLEFKTSGDRWQTVHDGCHGKARSFGLCPPDPHRDTGTRGFAAPEDASARN